MCVLLFLTATNTGAILSNQIINIEHITMMINHSSTEAWTFINASNHTLTVPTRAANRSSMEAYLQKLAHLDEGLYNDFYGLWITLIVINCLIFLVGDFFFASHTLLLSQMFHLHLPLLPRWAWSSTPLHCMFSVSAPTQRPPQWSTPSTWPWLTWWGICLCRPVSCCTTAAALASPAPTCTFSATLLTCTAASCF